MVAGQQAMRGPFSRRWAQGAVLWLVAGALLVVTFLGNAYIPVALVVLVGLFGGEVVPAQVA